MSSPYPVLDNRPIDQWKVTELKEELKRRKLTTKGLKEDLIRRLDEAIRNECESAKRNVDNGYNSGSQPVVESEQERKESSDAEAAKDNKIDGGDVNEVNIDASKVDARDTSISLNSVNIMEGELIDGAGSAEGKGEQLAQVTDVGSGSVISESLESAEAASGKDLQKETQNEIGDLKVEMENDDSRPAHVDAELNSSDQNNQVSEVSPDLGFQVKSDSLSTESVSINEKNDLKDNIIADDVKLELDVKPEMVQLSSNNVVPDGGNSHPMDVEEPQDSKVSVKETCENNDDKMDVVKTNNNGDSGSSEKLNLDRSSGDDSMEEDAPESKQIDSMSNSEKSIEGNKKPEAPIDKEEGHVDVVGDDLPAETKITDLNGPAALSVKRKVAADQEAVGNNDIVKRQRRWKTESLKIPESQAANIVVSTTPKDAFQPAFKHSFSRSDSMASEETPKERVVPPSPKPPTNSLRIDRFLRPFTLKAVQELLGKTGNVTSFWMDHIKTHCYVSYSSVEEAIETRNAVYNLQWPPNGGRLLVAEFVDAQEVKIRVEAPPVSPATPVSAPPAVPAAPPAVQPQPSPRQQVQRQQLPPPPSLPPPPTLPSVPPTRENLPPARERLPPPPPPPEKVDQPIVTLDDLFRKTKATPRVYYLPLSDEQVEAKLKSQGKNTKQ